METPAGPRLRCDPDAKRTASGSALTSSWFAHCQVPPSERGSNRSQKRTEPLPRLVTFRNQQDTHRMTRRSGKRWTAAEDRQLRREAARNTPTQEIASRLGRSENAVRNRASELFISLRPTSHSKSDRGNQLAHQVSHATSQT
jgi:hypothetical protein